MPELHWAATDGTRVITRPDVEGAFMYVKVPTDMRTGRQLQLVLVLGMTGDASSALLAEYGA